MIEEIEALRAALKQAHQDNEALKAQALACEWILCKLAGIPEIDHGARLSPPEDIF